MTIEQKAKHYDEALKWMRRLYPTMAGIDKEDAEHYFPELRESEDEDEKIRKWCVNLIKTTCDYDSPTSRKEVDDAIAWLEKQVYTKKDIDDAYLKGICDAKHELDKQGEQKPAVTDFNAKDWYVSKVDGKIHDMTYNHADKVEPKFKVGDWTVENEPNNYARFIQILEIVDVQGKERYRISRDLHNDEDVAECRFIENNYHSFTIQDAKPGDVLYSLDSFVPFIYKGRKTYEQASTYCGININGKFYVEGTKDCIICCEHYRPASSEQRSLLFSKMREAGYEWDAEKKELKKIEPKPTDEEMKELLRTEYEKGRADAIAETQVAWSEEDKVMLDEIIDFFENGTVKHQHDLSLYASWLKSLLTK